MQLKNKKSIQKESKCQSHAIQNKDIKLKESLIKIPISCNNKIK